MIIPLSLKAQYDIKGNVLNKTTLQPIAGVTIELRNITDSAILKTTSDKLGTFTFLSTINGKYQVYTNHIGFKKFNQEFEVQSKNKIIPILLEPAEISIEEVEISVNHAIVMKGDTMEFDSKNFTTKEFAEADELVAQIPGIQIDEEGNVTAHGESVTRIIVDGKEFFSTDPRIALKSLPAEIISKIQIIDEKSEQSRFSGFDDGKRSKVINIVTKPDKREGYFGKYNLGKGDTDKFSINASTNRFKHDLKFGFNLMANNLNETNFAEQGRGGVRKGNNNVDRGLSETYAIASNFSNTYFKKEMELSADYNFRSLNTLTNSLSNIEYLSTKQANQFRNQNQLADDLAKEHKFNSRIKWNIDSTNRIDFSPTLTYTSSLKDNSSSSLTTLNQESPINKSIRSNHSEGKNFAVGGNATYMHRFNKSGRTISLNINANKNSNDTEALNLATTSYFKNANLSRIDTNDNQNFTTGHGSGINTKISFTENISATSRLQANYNFRNTSNYSDKDTYEFLAETGQLGKLKDRLSNEFRNDYNYNSAGLSYIYNKKDSLRMQFGLNYQHGVRINDRTVPITLKTTADFYSFHPEFSMNYKFSKDRNFEFTYHTQTNTPSINQLQDFVNNQNELRISNGNPNLNQEYAHQFRVQYKDVNKIAGRTWTANMNFDYTNNKIVNSILMTDTSLVLFEDIILGAGGQYTVPQNVNGTYAFRASNSFGMPIKKLKINFNLFTRIFYNNDKAKLNGDLIDNQTYGFTQSLGLNSNFSKKYIFNVNYSIDSRTAKNALTPTQSYHTLNHKINTSVSLEWFKKVVMNSSILYLFNDGILNVPATETTIWNASIGYKILPKKNAEITLKAFDLLNNAQNINRRVNENNISETSSNTLTRYFALSATYNLRKFGKSTITPTKKSNKQSTGLHK